MTFLKKNKKIVIAVIAIAIILLIILLYNILFGGTGDSIYGSRLKGIDNVKISSDTKSSLEKEIKDFAEVDDVTYTLKGKIVNVIITLNDETSLDRGKEIANKVLEYFDEDQLAYYDFQVFLNSSNDESATYPQIGYKHVNSEGFVWKQE